METVSGGVPEPTECELEAIAALLTSALSQIGNWRDRARYLFDRGVRIQDGAALVGGVPEQGLPELEALLREWLRVQPYQSSPGHEEWRADFRARVEAALERPRPARPAPDDILRDEIAKKVMGFCDNFADARDEAGRIIALVRGAALPAEHAPPDAPTCSSHLWGVSCGHTSCPLHGPWEKKWAGRGPSAERDADFQRMVFGSRPALAGSPETGPYRLHVSEYEGDGFLAKPEYHYFVVRGAGKPACAQCKTNASTYDEGVFNSEHEVEAVAVRDALNAVAGRVSGTPEGTKP